MGIIRPTAVAGLFYPAKANVLAGMVDNELEKVSLPSEHHHPLAIIAPHAGYIYSGKTAAHAYKYLLPLHDIIKRVVLIGPSHRVAFEGVALSSVDLFETPLGTIPLDKASEEKLLNIAGVQSSDLAHESEHSLEVQLPFLQQVLDEFTLVPIVVGNARPELVSQLIETMWDGTETLIVISSDLSHYHDYQTAQQLDNATSQSILKLDYTTIHSTNACGHIGVNGLLIFARNHGLKPTIIDVRNSGDTAGDKQRVVGYGSYLFEAAPNAQ